MQLKDNLSLSERIILPMNLSKSLYTKGIQCQKVLWLKKYNKEVLSLPDDSALARFETGNEVGDLA